MSPSSYLWIAFGGAFALCAAEALFVWRASRNAAREPRSPRVRTGPCRCGSSRAR